MKFTLKTATGHDYEAYAYTGGKAFDPVKPTLVFIHGVLNDHSVWILQTRYLAHHGFNVLAVDLPGHGRSGGDAPTSVEEAAQFVEALLDAAGVKHAGLIGHSWGSLIALETAARLKDRITHIALVTHAWHMPRSLRQFEAAGLQVTPAPMGYIRSDSAPLLQWLPSGKGLRDSGWIIREWLGLLLT